MKNNTLAFLFITALLMSCTSVQKPDLGAMISNFEALQKEFDSESDWPQFDVEVLNNKKDKLTAFYNDLSGLDNQGLSVSERIDKDMLELIVTDEIEGLKFGTHEFSMNAEGGLMPK